MRSSNNIKIDNNSTENADLSGENLLTMTCGSCGIIHPDDWCGASDETLSVLNRRKCIRRMERGAVLFNQGDAVSSLYRLLDGIVLMRQVDCGGTVVTPHMASAGETIGFRAYVDGGVHGVSAICATDVVLCRIPADVAAQAFSGSHPLERAFARHVAAELSQTEDFVLAMTSRPVRDRLLLVFVRLYRQFGCHSENGVCRLLLPLLRSDIAALAGIARETFSRAMRTLEEENLVHLEGDTAVFPDIANFRRHAELIQPGAWAD